MNSTEAALSIIGCNGSEYVGDTSRRSGSWCKMLVVTNAILDEYTDSLMGSSSDILGVTLPAGITIGGNITSVKLSSGDVILFV